MAISLTSKELAKELSARARQTKGFVNKGGRSGMQRGKALLVKRSPTDLGQLRASWRLRGSAKAGYVLQNDAPMAGVVEEGARPHPVNAEGRDAIREWVIRVVLGFGKGGMGRSKSGPLTAMQAADPDLNAIWDRANAITQGIVNRLRREGQKGTFFVKGSLDEIRTYVQDEVERLISAGAGKAARGREGHDE